MKMVRYSAHTNPLPLYRLCTIYMYLGRMSKGGATRRLADLNFFLDKVISTGGKVTRLPVYNGESLGEQSIHIELSPLIILQQL